MKSLKEINIQMKKINQILIVLSLVFVFSCDTEDILTEKAISNQTADSFFSTPAGFEDLSKSIYPLLRNIVEQRQLVLNGTDIFAGSSGWDNVDNVLAPTIIIRNRQGSKSLDEKTPTEFINEDIIDDGSVIVLASGEHLLEFTPGQIDTPMETTPIYGEEPELKGTDQVLINSGRIILSSKDSEMLFYSKGNYSFISDGKLTIDNGLDGAEIDLNGEYRTTTNDNNMYFLGGAGEIYLNTESSAEPLSRGQTLIDILAELCDAINAQIFSTPAGPTMMGPNNRGDFNKIKSKLDTILSTLNYTE